MSILQIGITLLVGAAMMIGIGPALDAIAEMVPGVGGTDFEYDFLRLFKYFFMAAVGAACLWIIISGRKKE